MEKGFTTIARRERGQITLQRSSSQAYHAGSPVWVPEGLEQGPGKQKVGRWVKGVVLKTGVSATGATAVTVQTEDGSVREHLTEDLPLQNERDDTVDDLVKSDFLHEPGILHTLRVRYKLDMIYTYSGGILIAANPHKRLRQLYGPRMMGQYKGVSLGELSPHVYAIAEKAFSAMMIDDQRQAILISGESGAGKTESAKTVMQYLAQRAAQDQKQMPRAGSKSLNGGGKVVAPIEEQVLESNPLLEAFGNAKTVRNDNSSRFGKFTDMHFDVAGRVSGAAISTYLLEKSRIVSINSPERSYHIFYQLCAGANQEQKEALGLEGGASSFRYLAKSSTLTLPGVDDAEGFRSTLDAMAIVGLSESEQEAILQTVACVLHLGNVVFYNNDRDEAVPVDDNAASALRNVSLLLQVGEEELLKALTTRTIATTGERIVKHLNYPEANVSRDSLAKSLYAKLFDWLVAAINRKITALGKRQQGKHSIGILDIYGFESFKENSFEQLCINLANERLQQQFNQHVFKGEQEEYALEGIDWSYVEFVDNQDCLDLLEGGVFPLIDEACRLPRATYQDLAHTLRTRLIENSRFMAPKRPQHSFGVEHYAGRVTYVTNHVMDKNKDFVIQEHQQLLHSSQHPFIQQLFQITEADMAAEANSTAKRGGRSAYKLNSVGAQFRKQLQGLMGALNQCQPHYIRCIKPNPESRPGSLTPPYVLEQLRAGGVLEAVRIASAGFPTRKLFKPFAQRYSMLLASGKGTYQPLDMNTLNEQEASDICRRILQATKAEGWQLGKSRVFLRAGQLALLEGARGRRLSQSAIIIQSAFRCIAAKRQLRDARRAATKIQAAWRGKKGREAMLQARKAKAVIKLQSAWRMYRQRKVYLAYRRQRAATKIQAFVRMLQQRSRFRRATNLGRRQAERAAAARRRTLAATIIQKNMRMRLARKQLASLRAERTRWIALEESRNLLENEAAMWRSRYHQAAQRSDELASDVARIQSELLAAKLEVQNAIEAGNAKAALAKQATGGYSERQVQELETMQLAQQANALAEMEQSYNASQRQLLAELDAMRQRQAAANERAKRADYMVEDMENQQYKARSEIDRLAALVAERERENMKLWEQMRTAAAEYHQEFLAKEAANTQLKAEKDALRRTLEENNFRVQASMKARLANMEAEMQQRINAAVAENEQRMKGQREASEKNVHFSARVVALNSRMQNLQKQLKETQARERALMEELDEARQLAQTPQYEEELRPTPNGVSGHADGYRIPPASVRSLGEDGLSLRSSYQENLPPMMYESSEPAAAGAYRDFNGGATTLNETQDRALASLTTATLTRRLPILNIQYGLSPSDSIGMPVAAWILSECLITWTTKWGPSEAEAAALTMKDTILANTENETLNYQCYWLATTIAIGGIIRVRALGRKQYGGLFKLADDYISLNRLHTQVALSVSEMLPINISMLFSEEAKRSAGLSGIDATSPRATPTSFQALMNSPWKALLGGLSNVLEAMRTEGVPPPACRAVMFGALRYLNAELLNALMLRRDCCSSSAVKGLKRGISDIQALMAYMGSLWCGGLEDTLQPALSHTNEAIAFLLVGKDECARKAARGHNLRAELKQMCPSLTLPQLFRLIEYYHDDWLTSSQNPDTMLLLEHMKQMVDSPNANGHRAEAMHSHQPSMNSLQSYEEEETLLLDPQASFILPKRLLTDAAKYFVKSPPAYQEDKAFSGKGQSLLERIDYACRSNVQLPRQLRDKPEFSFLK